MEDKKEYSTSEARRKASKKYYEKNKQKEVYMSYYRGGKNFIKNTTEIEKLEEYINLAQEKINELKKEG